MSVRSGMFIKYAVEFVEASLTVSNDVLVGDVCIDADISVKMYRWTGTSFSITLYDLPEPKVKTAQGFGQGRGSQRQDKARLLRHLDRSGGRGYLRESRQQRGAG